jgi:NAD(P)H dehydrogenase (quinone)
MYGHVYRMAEAVAEERAPSENELAAARFQGKHVATLTAKLVR